MSDLLRERETAAKIVREAAELVRSFHGRKLKIESKHGNEPVTLEHCPPSEQRESGEKNQHGQGVGARELSDDGPGKRRVELAAPATHDVAREGEEHGKVQNEADAGDSAEDVPPPPPRRGGRVGAPLPAEPADQQRLDDGRDEPVQVHVDAEHADHDELEAVAARERLHEP